MLKLTEHILVKLTMMLRKTVKLTVVTKLWLLIPCPKVSKYVHVVSGTTGWRTRFTVTRCTCDSPRATDSVQIKSKGQ